MTALDLLAECNRRGVALATVAGGLKVTAPVGAVDDDLRALLRAHKPQLLLLVAPCPSCRKPTDRGRCWHCGWRGCAGCKRDTGSVFISTCLQCQRSPEQEPAP